MTKEDPLYVTKPYSRAELEAMMSDVESDLAERKESPKAKGIREAVCAFANDLPDHRRPGVLFVGARDDGTPSGLPVTDQLLTQLAGIKTDGNIVPPPTLFVSKQRLHGADVAVVVVHPSDSPPVRLRGRIWIRTGPSRAIATVQDERMLNEKWRHRDPHFDAQPVPTASLDDLDLRRFEEDYLPRAVDRDVLAANDRTAEERLAATKMVVSVEDPTPTVVGLLVLGVRPHDHLPGAYVQFLRLDGIDLTDEIVDETRCDGPLTQTIRRLDEKLVAHNRTSVDIVSFPRERRRSTYPMAALRQLVYNAIMHRAYERTNAPVRVLWFNDRIEIVNPGGPYGAVGANSFGQPGVVDYRNPTLAEAMRVLGLVQRYGIGIKLARRALKDSGQPEPEFRVEPDWLFCTVRAAK